MWQISKSGRIDRLIVFRFHNSGYVPVGDLTFEGSGRVRLGRFRYARSYLDRGDRKALDPVGLPLARRSFAAAPAEVPLAFYDAGPDGWGKGLLSMAFPKLELGMAEYLALGSAMRTGDLAFGPTPDGPDTWVPADAPLVTLPSADDDLEKLVDAAAAVEEGRATTDHFQLLLKSGADVGGARPKARLRHEGVEWIAKFSAWGDAFDEPRIEALCLDVAEAAGVRVPERKLIKVGAKSALLVRRFDRSANGRPYGYLSMATLLKQPPSDYGTTMTYADIASVARSIGVRSPEPEVFRRLLVNSYLHNTDDHLRNHAVIDAGDGWTLSPAFDLVPIKADRHVCGPAPGISPEWNPELSFSSHENFGLSREDAEHIREDVLTGMRRIVELMELREVTKEDRATLAPLLRYPLDVAATSKRPSNDQDRPPEGVEERELRTAQP